LDKIMRENKVMKTMSATLRGDHGRMVRKPDRDIKGRRCPGAGMVRE
jgi:hypothetical protein